MGLYAINRPFCAGWSKLHILLSSENRKFVLLYAYETCDNVKHFLRLWELPEANYFNYGISLLSALGKMFWV